jgi:homoserine O-acetyltransferase/O-succinyltransferase
LIEPSPVTGAWRPGDDPGRRQFVTFDDGLKLEADGRLESVTVAYETWGELAPDASNAVLVLHALSLDSHAAGAAGAGHGDVGWWDGVIGPGCSVDTDRFFVVCPNVLGGCQGTTGPSSDAPDGRPYGSRFPVTTIRDQVALEVALADALGIERWYALVGGSMGGMRVLEWAVGHRDRVARAVVISVGAQATAEEIALCHVQMRAIRADPKWQGGDYYDAEPGDGPHEGLAIARAIGHISYRTDLELAARFGRDHQPGEEPFVGGRYAVESYIDYQGDKLVRRFDANSYLILTKAMDLHDIARGRGSLEAAMARITSPALVIGTTSDILYPPYQQRQIADLLHANETPCEYVEIESPHGHDAFLIEPDAVGPPVAEFLTSIEKEET